MSAAVVVDTNIVLDLFVFADTAATSLRAAIDSGRLRWLATAGMREELERVLAYPQIRKRLDFYALDASAVLAHFDRHAHRVEAAPKAPVTCSDPDDQKFIDLAVAHGGWLLSKDQAVLSMRKRLAAQNVTACTAYPDTDSDTDTEISR
jgi:putative PIN family toxin of toxin-antitoxin system